MGLGTIVLTIPFLVNVMFASFFLFTISCQPTRYYHTLSAFSSETLLQICLFIKEIQGF